MVHRTINRLFQRGAEVLYDPIEMVHVSGHASQEEQKLMLNLVRPEHFIPIHGELRHLHAHARLARLVGVEPPNIHVVENGYPIEFDEGEARIGERVPGGYVYVDGSSVGDIGPSVLREREMLGRDRIRDDDRPPRSRERPPARHARHRHARVRLRPGGRRPARRRDSSSDPNRRVEWPRQPKRSATKVEKSLREYLYGETKRRPMIGHRPRQPSTNLAKVSEPSQVQV
jgi:ribonuclease J